MLKKSPGPKTASQIISWPKHKNCSQQLEEQTKPYKRFRNLPSASPAPPWFPSHHDYVNNSGCISWARVARGGSSSTGYQKQPSRNRWKQQKRILSREEEKSLHCRAALPSQPLPTKGCYVGLCSAALIYRKAEARLKYSPGYRKIPALSTANRRRQTIIPLGILSHIILASETEIHFLLPFNLSYSNQISTDERRCAAFSSSFA